MYFAFDGNVAEWLRRGLQILITLIHTDIISPLINLFTFNTECKCSPGPLMGHFELHISGVFVSIEVPVEISKLMDLRGSYTL